MKIVNSIVKSIISRYDKYDGKSIQLLKNVALSFGIKGISMIVSLVTIPAYINYLSNQVVLGMWFTAISMLSWILTFDLGIGNGLRHHLVKPIVNNNNEEIKRYISSAYISVGLVVAILSIMCIIIVPTINWNIIFNISSDIVDKDALLFMVNMLLVGILIQFWLKLITSIFYALQKSALPALLSLFSSVFMLAFTILFNAGNVAQAIKNLSIAYVITANIPYLIATVVLFSSKLRRCKPSIHYFSWKYATEVVKLGGTFFYLQILAMIMFSTNEFLITWLVDPKDVVTFQIYNRIFSVISTFFNLALNPVWSAVTEACVSKDYEWIKRLYNKLNKMLLIIIPFEVILILLMPMLIKLWLGEFVFEINLFYSIMFAIYNILFMKVSIDTNIIAGLGELKVQTIALTLTTIIKIILSFVIIHFVHSWIGIISANIVALIPYILIEYFDLGYRLRKHTKGETNDFQNV